MQAPFTGYMTPFNYADYMLGVLLIGTEPNRYSHPDGINFW
jgi:hypothetical protein